MSRTNAISKYISATWRNWTVSLGFVCLMILLSPYVSRHFFPCIPIAFAAMLGVMIYHRRNLTNQGLAIPYIVTVSLLIEGILLTGFNLTVRITDVYELAGKPVNDELPFIVQLTISPVLVLVSGLFMLRRLGHGRYFRTGSGRSDVSLVQRMVWQETRYQTRLMFLLALGMSAAVWCYTVFRFSSASINRPDMFFFVWMPLIVYILSLVYLGFRCFSLWAFYTQNDPAMMMSSHRSSIVRFLIVSGDSIYLSEHSLDVKQCSESYYDTPVRLRQPLAEHFSDKDARAMLMAYTGIASGIVEVKYMFDGLGHSCDSRIFRFLSVLSSPDDVDGSRIAGGSWFTLDQVRRLDRSHRLATELSADLVHIYTVAMAWKTYDINGNRRYPVRHYRPTFRLGDLKKWNVDYNDPRWLRVSALNADSRLFRLRRFLSRVTSPSMQ